MVEASLIIAAIAIYQSIGAHQRLLDVEDELAQNKWEIEKLQDRIRYLESQSL